MSECPKCGRTKCARPGSVTCRHYAEIYERGLREGIAIAKELAFAEEWNANRQEWERTGMVMWDGVDAELERRVSGKERGDA